MKKFELLLSLAILTLWGCSSTCMEYRSATTAARSEKNLKRAEKWALEALEAPECNPDQDAYAPYFLATEVYAKQKNYIKMAKMLTLAEARNPDQLLENPFKLGNEQIKTIQQGVNAHRDVEWQEIYNRAVSINNDGNIEKAKETFELAILINPNRAENYYSLASIFIQSNDMEMALNTVRIGIKIDNKNASLYQMEGDLLAQKNNLLLAEKSYLQAIRYAKNPGPIKRKLIFIYIDLGNNQKAINYSNALLDEYPNDPDLYYNVGVLYQRMAAEQYDANIEEFNNLSKNIKAERLKELYLSYKKAREYAYSSRDYFLQASDLEEEENTSYMSAAKEMKSLMKKIDEIFIPSIKKTAKTAGVELN